MSSRVQLGPFELEERIGEGGMGVVYRANHVETGAAVAVKVLLAEIAREENKQRDFRREVEALAKLHHPAIAAILDYGTIRADAARRGPPSLAEGAPWFAMEYIEGHPIRHVMRGWDWRHVEAFLLTTLDALAHAHARHVIHRDLKPSNILVADQDEEVEPDVTLVDFGVARVLGAGHADLRESPDRVVGTPAYMAPEQILGEWRDQGPWTDLYALGCLLWQIVCSDPPFDGADTSEVFRAHLQTRPPEFEPRLPVPEGFEQWLRRLLHNQTERRTRRAPDAAWQFLKLSKRDRRTAELTPVGRGQSSGIASSQPTLRSMGETVSVDTAATREEKPPEAGVGRDPEETTRLESISEVPSVLPDWRRRESEQTAAVVPKAGLQLFGLREVPMVDREEERDRLWEALRRVRREEEPELITLEAPAGAGKTRLGEWLGRRARETGAARTLRATHAPSSAPSEGLRGMVQRAFRTEDLPPNEVYNRLLERLPSSGADDAMRLLDARALTELLRPSADDDSERSPRYSFSSLGQTFGLFRRLFGRMARERPVVVWFDDLQWGRESIAVLEEMFTNAATSPAALVVATVRSDVVSEHEDVRERLHRLYDVAGAERVGLSALGPEDHRRLVDRLLDLSPELAARLAERTEGNPLFAIQLLRDWVDRDVLRPSDRGFELADRAVLELPDSIHRLWIDRLRRFVGDIEGGSDEEVWRALETAAALGADVEAEEWTSICREHGLDADRVADELVGRGLAGRTGDGWSFAHGLLVESIERRSRDAGAWRDRHRFCARLLGRLDTGDRIGRAERRAEHWIEAGELERALQPLLERVNRVRRRGHPQGAREALRRRREILKALEIPADDLRRIENDVFEADVELELGAEPGEILDATLETRERMEGQRESRLMAIAWRVTARAWRMSAEFEKALEAIHRAVDQARRCEDERELDVTLAEMTWLEILSGNLDPAESLVERRRERARARGELHLELQANHHGAWIEMTRGALERAERAFTEVLEESRAEGFRWLELECLNGLGELARYREEPGEAREYYRDHRRLARELNRPQPEGTAELNLAFVEMMDEQFDRADAHVEEARRQHRAMARAGGMSEVWRLCRLVIAAGRGDWTEFDPVLRGYQYAWSEEKKLVRDRPWLLEMAGDYALQNGSRGRAEEIWRLAAVLWERLESPEEVARVESKIEGGE